MNFTFVIIAALLQILLVAPVYFVASHIRKSDPEKRNLLAIAYGLYVFWCLLLTGAIFLIPSFQILIAVYYLLIPVVPIAMVIGLGVLYWVLDSGSNGAKKLSALKILIIVIIALLLVDLYARGNPANIPVPEYIQEQKSDFEAQIRESGGTVNDSTTDTRALPESYDGTYVSAVTWPPTRTTVTNYSCTPEQYWSKEERKKDGITYCAALQGEGAVDGVYHSYAFTAGTEQILFKFHLPSCYSPGTDQLACQTEQKGLLDKTEATALQMLKINSSYTR